jgi:hypothetical protein
MKPILKHALAAILLMLTFAAPVAAGPSEDGLTAFKRGDYVTAMRLWRPLADQGNAPIQAVVGAMYENGQGVPQNYAAALSWYRKAADKGDALAQNSLGAMYGSGRGVPQNYAEAVKWYRLAADQGYADAQFNIGVMYFKGQDVAQDYAQAMKWFREAADQGKAKAQIALWGIYFKGLGVPQDYNQAMKWAREAADQGDAAGQSVLGSMYTQGQGVPKDYISAYMWANLAAARGAKDMGELRDRIARLMTPTQIAEAQKLAREWKPTKQPLGIQNASGETAEEKLTLATKLVVDCYLERLKVDVAKRMTPKDYETSIHTECFERENFLKLTVNDTVNPSAATPESYLTKLRHTSVVKYFVILGDLFPEFKDRCGGEADLERGSTLGSSTFDKTYACVIRQK